MNQVQKLRAMLKDKGIIRAPGAYDAWSARLIEKAGFPAVYMTGYGVSASVLGKPDIGFISLPEMATMAKNMCAAVSIPVIADADTGYGGVLNVMRTVKEYMAAGVAAIQLEDQVFPKRCGHMEGKEIIAKDEMVAKIKAAVAAREGGDIVIIARTDARAVTGFADGLERVQAYLAAGADVIFFEAPESEDEIKEVAAKCKAPLLANMVEKGKTPMIPGAELEKLGYKIAIYPVSTLYAATKNVLDVLTALKRDDTTATIPDAMVSFPEFNKLVGVQDHRDLEKSFS